MTINDFINYIKQDQFPLAPLCKPCNPPEPALIPWPAKETKTKGKQPMRYDNNTTAVVMTNAQPTEASVQRSYLLNRLTNVCHYHTLREAFNLDVDNSPKTYKDLIDAIKNDKFTLDEKITKRIDAMIEDQAEDDDFFFFNGAFNGIIWNGPKPDFKGFGQASKEVDKQRTIACDIIMTSDAAEGLKALQAYENWKPTVATTTAQ